MTWLTRLRHRMEQRAWDRFRRQHLTPEERAMMADPAPRWAAWLSGLLLGLAVAWLAAWWWSSGC